MLCIHTTGISSSGIDSNGRWQKENYRNSGYNWKHSNQEKASTKENSSKFSYNNVDKKTFKEMMIDPGGDPITVLTD